MAAPQTLRRFSIVNMSTGLKVHYRIIRKKDMEIVYDCIDVNAEEICQGLIIPLEALESIHEREIEDGRI
jgi:hypothetical protein